MVVRNRSLWNLAGRACSRLLLLATGAGLLAGAAPAGATLLVYEPFLYEAGTILDGTPATGLNLTGSYVALGTLPQQKLAVASPGLDFGSLDGAPSPAGLRLTDTAGVTAAGGTVSLDQDVLVGPGTAIFWSALLTLDDSSNGNHLANVTFTDDDTGDLLRFGEPGVGSRALRVEAETAAIGALLAEGSDNAFEDGETLFLVGRYVNSASSDADSLHLLGYSTGDADLLPSAFDPGDPNAELAFALTGLDIDLAKISSIGFTIRGNDNNFIDELRIGSTWASVVPEPGPAALLLVGLLGLWRGGARPRPR